MSEVPKHSYLENQEEGIPPLPGSIQILVEKDGKFVPSGDYFHPNQVLQSPASNAEFETLKQQYLASLEYTKELEGKVKDLTSRLNVLENSVGTGISH